MAGVAGKWGRWGKSFLDLEHHTYECTYRISYRIINSTGIPVIECALTPAVFFGSHGVISYEFRYPVYWYIYEYNFACSAAPQTLRRKKAVSTVAGFMMLLLKLLSMGFRWSNIMTCTVHTAVKHSSAGSPKLYLS